MPAARLALPIVHEDYGPSAETSETVMVESWQIITRKFDLEAPTDGSQNCYMVA